MMRGKTSALRLVCRADRTGPFGFWLVQVRLVKDLFDKAKGSCYHSPLV